MTQVTGDPIYGSKGQRSRSPGRLMTWPKISHIFGTGKHTNFKLGVEMEYNDQHHRHAQWSPKLKALGGCSSHHLQGAGAYCGSHTAGGTACYICVTLIAFVIFSFLVFGVLYLWCSALVVSNSEALC